MTTHRAERGAEPVGVRLGELRDVVGDLAGVAVALVEHLGQPVLDRNLHGCPPAGVETLRVAAELDLVD